jgi:hypothetical protein
VHLLQGGHGGRSERVTSQLFSAFAAPSDWEGRDAAIGDDVDFWLALEKGFQRGTRKQVVRLTWLALHQVGPEMLYVSEGDNEEPLETRFLVDVQLEVAEGGALRISNSETIRVRMAFEQYKASRAKNLPHQREGVNLDECTICAKGDEDVQVLCDRCDLGWHLECLNQSGVEVPDDVFHPEVVWYCPGCKDEEEVEMASVVAYERVAEQDVVRRASRVGRVVRPPRRFED